MALVDESAQALSSLLARIVVITHDAEPMRARVEGAAARVNIEGSFEMILQLKEVRRDGWKGWEGEVAVSRNGIVFESSQVPLVLNDLMSEARIDFDEPAPFPNPPPLQHVDRRPRDRRSALAE